MPRGIYIRTAEHNKNMSLSKIGKKRIPFVSGVTIEQTLTERGGWKNLRILA